LILTISSLVSLTFWRYVYTCVLILSSDDYFIASSSSLILITNLSSQLSSVLFNRFINFWLVATAIIYSLFRSFSHPAFNSFMLKSLWHFSCSILCSRHSLMFSISKYCFCTLPKSYLIPPMFKLFSAMIS